MIKHKSIYERQVIYNKNYYYYYDKKNDLLIINYF